MSQTLNLVPRSCFLTSGLRTGSPWREVLGHAKPLSSPRKKVFMNFMLVRKSMMIFASFAPLREYGVFFRASCLDPRAWGNQQRVTRNEKPIRSSFLAFLRPGARSLPARSVSIDLMSESGVSWRGENKYVVNVTTLVVILATTGHEHNN